MSLIVTNAVLDGKRVSICCDDGVISRIGRSIDPHRGSDIIDACGMAITPGLVNGHTHAAMTLFRGYGSDLQLQEWLHDWIFPAEARLRDEDIYWGTRLAIAEMLRSGTVHFFDMYFQAPVVAQAAVDSGIRATIGEGLFDMGDRGEFDRLQHLAERSVTSLSSFGDRVRPALTPHSIYLVSERSLQWIAEFSTEQKLPVHLHFCETTREVEEWRARRPERPVEYLARLGLLHERTLLAHACVLDLSDFKTIAGSGATVVTNPVSNAKLGGPVFPYSLASEGHTPIGLGTDGAGSNNSLDLLSDAKFFSLLQKQANADPALLPAAETLAIAQGQRSALLGGRAIEVGAPADFLLVDTTKPEMTPGDPVDNLVYSASGAVVHTTVVAGAVVMENGGVPELDEIVGNVRRCARRLRG